MSQLSTRLNKLEGTRRTGRLISVGVFQEEDVAPLLAQFGIELRESDVLVTQPYPTPTLFGIDNEVFGCGHRLEQKLYEDANGPVQYATRPTTVM